MPVISLSDHPVDYLIRELVRTGRSASKAEVTAILDRIAVAEFDGRLARVPSSERGLKYLNRALGDRDDSIFVHLVRRVLIDEQWATGTSPTDYLDDLRRSVRADSLRLAVYARRGGVLAATLTPTFQVVPKRRLGPRSLPSLFVVYSADRGIIVTGYQVSNVKLLDIPEGAQWLL